MREASHIGLAYTKVSTIYSENHLMYPNFRSITKYATVTIGLHNAYFYIFEAEGGKVDQ